MPLYPAHRSYEGSADGRAAWEEVFHDGRLTAAFENHDHVFKRSHPLRLGEIVGEGESVLYLGDGCMGQDARTVDLEERWYLAKSASEPHFWTAELSSEGAVYRAFDEEGQLLDLVSTGDVATPPGAGDVLPELDRTVEMPGETVDSRQFREFLTDDRKAAGRRWVGSKEPLVLLPPRGEWGDGRSKRAAVPHFRLEDDYSGHTRLRAHASAP